MNEPNLLPQKRKFLEIANDSVIILNNFNWNRKYKSDEILNNTERSLISKIPAGEPYVILDGTQIQHLRTVLKAADSRARRHANKLDRGSHKYSEENWNYFASEDLEEATGLSKDTIEQLSKVLNVFNVHKDLGYKIGNIEALTITLIRFFDNTSFATTGKKTGHPTSVVAKVVPYVVSKTLEVYGDLIDFEKNPLLTEQKVKQYVQATQIRDKVVLINSDTESPKEKDTYECNNARNQKPLAEYEENDLESQQNIEAKDILEQDSTGPHINASDEQIESLQNQELVSKKRSQIFCTLVPLNYQAVIDKISNARFYHKHPFQIEMFARDIFRKYSAVVGPDGMFLGLIGDVPGANTFKELLLKKNIPEIMEKFQYPKNNDSNKSQDSLNEKQSNPGDSQAKEKYYMYGGWLFEDILNTKPIPQVLTVGDISRSKFAGKTYRDEFSVIPEMDDALGVRFKCPKCNFGSDFDFDTPQAWRYEFSKRGRLRNDWIHWFDERCNKDHCKSFGEDQAAWAFRSIGLEAVHSALFSRFRYATPKNTLDLKREDYSFRIKFALLINNFVNCIEGKATSLGIKPMDLETYVHLVTKNQPEIVKKAQFKAAESSLFDQNKDFNESGEWKCKVPNTYPNKVLS